LIDRDAEMVPRWTTTGLLDAAKSFRKIPGHRQLWVRAAVVGRSIEYVDVKVNR
jgi:hypothetical protein